MLAIFVAAIILWITEAIPNYLTSLLVILSIVLTGVTTEKTAFAQLGHPVMWLNILSFILASMLVKTQVAKRFALWFVLRFGKNSFGVMISFIVINLVLSAFISATTAKAAILLPIFMVVAAIYGATGGENRNNFGRNLVLQNLFQINLGANGFLTGSGATLLAASLIAGALGENSFGYTKWLVPALPMSILLILIAWFVGTRLVFRLKPEEKKPCIEGGMERLRQELHNLGPCGGGGIMPWPIFVCVLGNVATETPSRHSPTSVGLYRARLFNTNLPKFRGLSNGTIVTFPGTCALSAGPLHPWGPDWRPRPSPEFWLPRFCCPFGITPAARTRSWLLTVLRHIFSRHAVPSRPRRSFLCPYHQLWQKQFGYPVMSLAFPVAMLVGHVYVLPFNSKPAALLYTTNHYSWSDTFKFGITMMLISWFVIILWGETVLRWLGYTNGVFF